MNLPESIPSFPSTEDVLAAGRTLARATSVEKLPKLESHYLKVTPGSVSVSRAMPPTSLLGESHEGVRTQIVEFSRKSHRNMIKRFASLDLSPLFTGGRILKMLTPTLPGDWKTFKNQIKALKKRYQHRYGEPITGLWKLEFQFRGAPHLHILTSGPTKDRRSLASWLSKAWAECVGHPDPEEFAKHLRAGTAVDRAKGRHATDPRLAALYFSKHSSQFAAKQYQNTVPPEFHNVGRFWGYWGLKPALNGSEVTGQSLLQLLVFCAG